MHSLPSSVSLYLNFPSRTKFTSTISSSGVNEGEKQLGAEANRSGTSARGRRLVKLKEEKHRREQHRLNHYPSWAKVLEDACKNDAELRAVLGDSIGDPERMRKRVEERVRKKGQDFQKSKSGSVLAFKVSFRDFNPLDSFIWVELFGSPTDRDVDLFGSVIQAWYVMGRLGSFNSLNLQLAKSSIDYNPIYDAEKSLKVMPSSFHDISDVEFQDNWGRFWVDLGTCDYFAIDVLLNSLTVLSSEYLGIKQVVFGGRSMGDWEEGMTNSEWLLSRFCLKEENEFHRSKATYSKYITKHGNRPYKLHCKPMKTICAVHANNELLMLEMGIEVDAMPPVRDITCFNGSKLGNLASHVQVSL